MVLLWLNISGGLIWIVVEGGSAAVQIRNYAERSDGRIYDSILKNMLKTRSERQNRKK